MVSEDISLKKYMLQSSADTNEREEMSVRLDDIETTVNDVKLKVTDDISKVIAYCKGNITSLDIWSLKSLEQLSEPYMKFEIIRTI